MTELAIVEHQPTSDGYRSTALARLGEWAESAQAAYQVAVRLCTTSFVPNQFKDKPDETTAAILAGAEVGLTPMAALRSFDIIEGVAAPRALTLRAIAQSMGHEIRTEESTATRAIVRARRRGEEWQTVTWTIDRATQLGVVNRPTKSGRPNQWKTQPQAMLVARATAEAARLIAADAILGIGYAAEEISDGIEGTAPPIEPMPTAKTRRMSLPKTGGGGEPSNPSHEAPEGDGRKKVADGNAESADARQSEPPPPPGLTPKQRTTIMTLFNGLGIGRDKRDERLAITRVIIGRDIESANELSIDEASRLIDKLSEIEREDDPRGALVELMAQAAHEVVQETFDAEVVEEGA